MGAVLRMGLWYAAGNEAPKVVPAHGAGGFSAEGVKVSGDDAAALDGQAVILPIDPHPIPGGRTGVGVALVPEEWPGTMTRNRSRLPAGMPSFLDRRPAARPLRPCEPFRAD